MHTYIHVYIRAAAVYASQLVKLLFFNSFFPALASFNDDTFTVPLFPVLVPTGCSQFLPVSAGVGMFPVLAGLACSLLQATSAVFCQLAWLFIGRNFVVWFWFSWCWFFQVWNTLLPVPVVADLARFAPGSCRFALSFNEAGPDPKRLLCSFFAALSDLIHLAFQNPFPFKLRQL